MIANSTNSYQIQKKLIFEILLIPQKEYDASYKTIACVNSPKIVDVVNMETHYNEEVQATANEIESGIFDAKVV